MSQSKARRLTQGLEELIEVSSNVEAAAVVSFDGLAMASGLPEEMDDGRVGAMSAALADEPAAPRGEFVETVEGPTYTAPKGMDRHLGPRQGPEPHVGGGCLDSWRSRP